MVAPVLEVVESCPVQMPWLDNPYRPYGLLDMIEITGAALLRITSFFRDMTLKLYSDGIASRGQGGVHTYVSEKHRGQIRGHCLQIADESEQLGLKATARKLRRVAEAFGDPLTYFKGQDHFQHAGQVFHDEANAFYFVVLNESEVERYTSGKAEFSADLFVKLPNSLYDIEEACRAYALNAWTASVFHLMRVVEMTIQAWATGLGIPAGFITKNGKGSWREMMWGDLENEIQAYVDALPDSTPADKAVKDQQRSALAAFGNMRHAWRNPTMHPAAKYDQREARDVFETTRIFLDRVLPVI